MPCFPRGEFVNVPGVETPGTVRSWHDGGVTAVSVRDQVCELLASCPDGVLPLVHAGHPVLRREAGRYEGQLGADFMAFIDAMNTTMVVAPGVGLAAPQVGVSLAVAVMRDPGAADDADPRERVAFPMRVLVNPVYEPVGDEKVSFFEGCLSVPGYQAVVARWRRVRVMGWDETGAPVDEVLTGWPARIAQHEIDHLRGVLYVDRAHLRSLSTMENLAQWWSVFAHPHAAGEALGFPVEQQGSWTQ